MATGGGELFTKQPPTRLLPQETAIRMVYRAKGTVKDMEFVQFHPTAPLPPGRPSVVPDHRSHARLREAYYVPKTAKSSCKSTTHVYRWLHATFWPAIDNEMKNLGRRPRILDVTQRCRRNQKHFPQHLWKCMSLGHRYNERIYSRGPAAHYLAEVFR